VQNNPNRIRWDLFVTNTSNTKGVLPSRPLLIRNRQRPLPPVRASNTTSRINQSVDRRTSVKQVALPPIDNRKKIAQNIPIVLILSKFFSLKKKRILLFSVRFIEFNKIMLKINGTLQSNNLFIY